MSKLFSSVVLLCNLNDESYGFSAIFTEHYSPGFASGKYQCIVMYKYYLSEGKYIRFDYRYSWKQLLNENLKKNVFCFGEKERYCFNRNVICCRDLTFQIINVPQNVEQTIYKSHIKQYYLITWE